MAAVAYIQGLDVVGRSKSGASATTATQQQPQTHLSPACCTAARPARGQGEVRGMLRRRPIRRHARALAHKERPHLAMAEPSASGARAHDDYAHGAEWPKPIIRTLFKVTQKLLAITLEI
jgi:hypothetical protein